MDGIVCFPKVQFGFYHSWWFSSAPIVIGAVPAVCLYVTVTASGTKFSVHLYFPAVAFSVKGVAFSDSVVLEQALP